VAKRRNGKYEPGLRSGAWQMMRINQGQEFVIAGYTPSDKTFDALIIGYYEKGKLLYAARTRNGCPGLSVLYSSLGPARSFLIDVLPFLKTQLSLPFTEPPTSRSCSGPHCQR
jgi:hypothetical protein